MNTWLEREPAGSWSRCHFQGMPWKLAKCWNRCVWQLQFWLLLTIPNQFCWRLMCQGQAWGSAVPEAGRQMIPLSHLWQPILKPHEKNYHSTKLQFLALMWVVTEHFKEYLLYQPFLIKTDNNPLTYIMLTPNLDATGQQWVRALAWFNFELEYQEGCDNTVADVLSWVTTWLDPDTVRSIFDG